MTGASGVGKTTLVRALDAQAIPGLRCHYFDSIGVPPVTHMTAQFGSPETWQQSTTERWVTYLVANETGTRVALLEGQLRPSEVRAAFARQGITRGRILLVDCDHEARDARLRNERGQPELATPRMAAWAAYLRGQADALELPIFDTTQLTLAQAEQGFIECVRAWTV